MLWTLCVGLILKPNIVGNEGGPWPGRMKPSAEKCPSTTWYVVLLYYIALLLLPTSLSLFFSTSFLFLLFPLYLSLSLSLSLFSLSALALSLSLSHRGVASTSPCYSDLIPHSHSSHITPAPASPHYISCFPGQ